MSTYRGFGLEIHIFSRTYIPKYSKIQYIFNLANVTISLLYTGEVDIQQLDLLFLLVKNVAASVVFEAL